MSRIVWGVDGYGTKHYLCDYCGLVFGDVDPELIKHECDTSKPRYHNRDKLAEDLDMEFMDEALKSRTIISDLQKENANLKAANISMVDMCDQYKSGLGELQAEIDQLKSDEPQTLEDIVARNFQRKMKAIPPEAK